MLSLPLETYLLIPIRSGGLLGATAPRLAARRTASVFAVFAEDLLCCPRCHGRMRVIAFITDPAPIGKILTHLGLPTAPPRVAPARAPPEPLFLDERAFA